MAPREVMTMSLVTTMPDGSEWAVPVEVIARNRAREYADEFGGDIERSLSEDTVPMFSDDDYEITDWAQNNMNWSDVERFAVCVKEAAKDFQEGWVNGDKEVVDDRGGPTDAA